MSGYQEIRLSGSRISGHQVIRTIKFFSLIFWYPDNLPPDELIS